MDEASASAKDKMKSGFLKLPGPEIEASKSAGLDQSLPIKPVYFVVRLIRSPGCSHKNEFVLGRIRVCHAI